MHNGWEDCRTYAQTETMDVPSTPCKNFVNFGPVTSEILWHVCRKWVDARMQNNARLHCFHQTDSRAPHGPPGRAYRNSLRIPPLLMSNGTLMPQNEGALKTTICSYSSSHVCFTLQTSKSK